MVKSKEDLLFAIKDLLGDNVSDEALAVLEDVSDTVSDLTTRAEDTTDWKAKFDENDAAWRKRYKDRFFGNGDEVEQTEEVADDIVPPATDEEVYDIKIEDLF